MDTVGISNSGFIEPFLYATLMEVENRGKSEIDYFFELGGAIEPLKGIKIKCARSANCVKITLPNGKVIHINKEVLGSQRAWLKEQGKTNKILKEKLGGR